MDIILNYRYDINDQITLMDAIGPFNCKDDAVNFRKKLLDNGDDKSCKSSEFFTEIVRLINPVTLERIKYLGSDSMKLKASDIYVGMECFYRFQDIDHRRYTYFGTIMTIGKYNDRLYFETEEEYPRLKIYLDSIYWIVRFKA